jgi:endo-1,4-beta-xylanase
VLCSRRRQVRARLLRPGDALATFARDNDIALRGHTVVWHHPRWLPDWVNNLQFANAAEAEAMIDGEG